MKLELKNRIYSLLALLFLGSASIMAQGDDPFGDFNPRLYQNSMTFIAQVIQNGVPVTEGVVAAYCGDELRGKRPVGTDPNNPNLVFLMVYGNSTGTYDQFLHFKVFTGGQVFTFEPDPAIYWKTNAQYGSASAPYLITLPISLANDADNSSVLTSFETETCDVVLNGRTLFKDGSWNTLCLPFGVTDDDTTDDITFSGTPLQGASLMELDTDGKNGFDTEDGTLYLWFKTATEIEAGVPYLIKWEKAADYDENPSAYDIVNPVFKGVTISSTVAQTVESTTTGLETVLMVGTYSPVSVTADDKSILFMGDANTLYYSSINRHIRTCRAYFSVPYIKGNAGAKTCAFVLNFDGKEATGILEASVDSNEMKDDAWYSLEGVRLSGKPTQRGMYINKGKKFVIK